MKSQSEICEVQNVSQMICSRILWGFIYFLGGLFLLLQIALWTGLVMGGGAGLTVPGRFGVATEKTVSAFFS
jgi:hypothetical protein